MSDVGRCLMALYAQVPAVVADDVQRKVMNRIEELEAELAAKDAVVDAAEKWCGKIAYPAELSEVPYSLYCAVQALIALRAHDTAKGGDDE